VGQPLDGVGPEVVVLALLAVGDDRRAGGLEARDGVPDRLVIERVQRGVRAAGGRNSFDQPTRPRDTPDWLGWDLHPLCSLLPVAQLTPRLSIVREGQESAQRLARLLVDAARPGA